MTVEQQFTAKDFINSEGLIMQQINWSDGIIGIYLYSTSFFNTCLITSTTVAIWKMKKKIP